MSLIILTVACLDRVLPVELPRTDMGSFQRARGG